MHTAAVNAAPTAVGSKATSRRPLESVAATWPIGVKIAAAMVVIGAFVAQLVNRGLLDMSGGYASYFGAISTNPAATNVSVIAGMFAPALLVGSVLLFMTGDIAGVLPFDAHYLALDDIGLLAALVDYGR